MLYVGIYTFFLLTTLKNTTYKNCKSKKIDR